MVYAHIYCIYYVCVCKLHFFASMRKYRDEGTNSSSTSRSKDNNIKESSMRQQMYIERCTSTYVPKVPMYSSGGLMASLYAWLSLHCSAKYFEFLFRYLPSIFFPTKMAALAWQVRAKTIFLLPSVFSISFSSVLFSILDESLERTTMP